MVVFFALNLTNGITLDSEKFQIYIVVGVDYVRLDGVVHVGAILGKAQSCLGGTGGEYK